ncbi:hypothetical protein V866_000578 [Kwoniella sp. B9012]
MSAASPTPSNMPPPAVKRPRPSGAGASSNTAPQGGSSRTKRRKPDVVATNVEESSKGKDDELLDPGEVKTKIDFNELPVETLYKYLEYHDLLPRWDVSPWSEEPCTPPNQLYTLSSSAPIVPPPSTTITATSQTIHQSQSQDHPQTQPQTQDQDTSAQLPQTESHESTNGTHPINGDNGMMVDEPQLPQLPPTASVSAVESTSAPAQAADQAENIQPKSENDNIEKQIDHPANGQGENTDQPEDAEGTVDNFEPPTTRSKTLPVRQPITNTPSPEPVPQIKRGVITLSDIYAAREVLAEKANNHWMKGLGGGQNKEGETIVNFLYKMKVGQGRLLRVYNPTPANYSW